MKFTLSEETQAILGGKLYDKMCEIDAQTKDARDKRKREIKPFTLTETKDKFTWG